MIFQDTLATLIREKALEQKAFAGFWIRSCAFHRRVPPESRRKRCPLLLNALGIMDMQTLSGLVDAYYKNPTANTDTSMAILHARGM